MVMNESIKIFQKLAMHNDNSIVFLDLLDYCIYQHLVNKPKKLKFRSRYTNETGYFYDLYCDWVTVTNKKIEEYGWFDYWGTLYTEIILSDAKASQRGQFFTELSVCESAVQLLSNSIKKEEDEGGLFKGRLYDPAAGSGRLLCCFQSKEQGYYMVAEDLDEMACKMCVLNFLIHGISGCVVNMDSLSREFYREWKVNEQLPLTGILSIEEL